MNQRKKIYINGNLNESEANVKASEWNHSCVVEGLKRAEIMEFIDEPDYFSVRLRHMKTMKQSMLKIKH